ncbi:hypothetical protein D7Y13_10100 [Corallococcus praedator]|uniref:Uncharacterized protein n=1 Tax=Corallococcus praedator TaxID=2316724 RepID=A0ABX9QKY0_9BACT|nr:hypothetical protein D7Y13_10100 [Corallococcus praedator]
MSVPWRRADGAAAGLLRGLLGLLGGLGGGLLGGLLARGLGLGLGLRLGLGLHFTGRGSRRGSFGLRLGGGSLRGDRRRLRLGSRCGRPGTCLTRGRAGDAPLRRGRPLPPGGRRRRAEQHHRRHSELEPARANHVPLPSLPPAGEDFYCLRATVPDGSATPPSVSRPCDRRRGIPMPDLMRGMAPP